jgi:hypothetical protein
VNGDGADLRDFAVQMRAVVDQFSVGAQRASDALTEWARLYASNALIGSLPDVLPTVDYPDERGCRLCGATIELGCCTRCGVPEE